MIDHPLVVLVLDLHIVAKFQNYSLNFIIESLLAVEPLSSQHTTESVILQEFLDEYYSEKNSRKRLKEVRKSHNRRKSRSGSTLRYRKEKNRERKEKHIRRKRNHENKVSDLQILSMLSSVRFYYQPLVSMGCCYGR